MIFSLLAVALAAPEVCNGHDDDGDGHVDEFPSIMYTDSDGDGFGDPAHPILYQDCEGAPAGVANDTDCDDGDHGNRPGAHEVCDTIDNDCDGQIDEDDTCFCRQSSFEDSTYQVCDYPVRQSHASDSCALAGYHLAKVDSAGEDGHIAGEIAHDPTNTWWIGLYDDDGSGGEDWIWEDTSPATYFNWGTNQPNKNNQRCVSKHKSDNDRWYDSTCSDANKGYVCEAECTPDIWYDDFDGDGFGDPDLFFAVESCAPVPHKVRNQSDCDGDQDAHIHPNAEELCNGRDDDCDGAIDEGLTCIDGYLDADEDGFGDPHQPGTGPEYVANSQDCDDLDPHIHPNAQEICDGHDQDCDTLIDDGVTQEYWFDGDHDGFGFGASVAACAMPPFHVQNVEDCDDTDAHISPMGTEVCDGHDNDCDLQVDEEVGPLWYRDADVDGQGAGPPLQACDQPLQYVDNQQDCDDTSGHTYVGAPEICDGHDNDCNHQIDDHPTGAPTFYADDDSDGYGDATQTLEACSAPAGFVADATDCDDTLHDVHPGAPELCNARDDNCNMVEDENPTDGTAFYADSDGDGYGSVEHELVACDAPPNFLLDPHDCDDDNPLVNPAATEVCDQIDNDCDSVTDEPHAVGAPTWYLDDDGDDYGDPAVSAVACEAPPDHVDNDQDCDDERSTAFPGATELCNELDDDCDGTADNNTGVVQWYVDGDGDGFGDAEGPLTCDPPDGHVTQPHDCNDDDSAVHPDAHEVCDTIDNDCDNTTDLDAIDRFEVYPDTDGDGFGDIDSPAVSTCTPLPDHVPDHADCDDGASAVNPHAHEVCDTIDNDCDGVVDTDAIDLVEWFPDFDADGYGDQYEPPIRSCTPPPNRVANNNDCDDESPTTYVDAPELCDLIDNDCDGIVDDENDLVFQTWFVDADLDGWGDVPATVQSCAPALGESAIQGDCDDNNPFINPQQLEVCDTIDNDCDHVVDLDAIDATAWYLDTDDDGFGAGLAIFSCDQPAQTSPHPTDCDDSNPLLNPDADELCDLVDNNCNQLVDEDVNYDDYYPDVDDDGYGDESASATPACRAETGRVLDNTDCDDSNSQVNPGQTEIPGNHWDDDCVGGDEHPPRHDTDLPHDTQVPSETGLPLETGDEQGIADTGCACTHQASLWTLRRR